MAALARHVVVVVVAAMVATAQCGAWQNLPTIPAGRRAQYYLLLDSGAYKYGYDTGAGHSARADADPSNEVTGHFAYVGADGRPVSTSYTAGQGGYVPQLDGAAQPTAGSRIGQSVVPSGISAAAPYSGAEDGSQDPDYDANADASYSFNIDTDSYQRSEQSDARGNIQGRYSYSSPVGGSHALSYVAGEGTGFVVTGSSSSGAAAGSRLGSSAPAPAAAPYSGPAANVQGGANPDGSYSFSFGTSDQSRQESADALNNVRGSYSFTAPDDGQTRRVDYEAGSATGFVARGSHLPVAPSVPSGPSSGISAYSAPASPSSGSPTPYSGPASNAQGGANADGSYSFSFSTNEQSRQESADSQNNVRGSYSFTAPDDGQTRRVDYEAGSATGFVARGNHLPVAPSVPSGPSAPGSGVSAYSAPAAPAATPYSGSASNAQGGANADGSYSFSFGTNEQSRQESADSKNNVRGSYSFRTPDDGQTRRVDYEAGSATGFVARGDHLPVAPSIPSAPGSPVSAYSAPSIPSIPSAPASGATPYSGPASNAQGGANPDGSYSFSFSTNEQSRQESADAQNNVRGSYSFRTPDDGQTRSIDYEAGSATGFVARGDHLPVAPSIPSAPGFSISAYSAPSIPSAPAATPYSGPTSNAQGGANPDGSYSFSFSTNEQSRQESADAQNNVRGSYSFRTPNDGQTRRVDYEAGSASGFVARGDHLPQAPSVPSGASSRLGSGAPGISGASGISESSSNGDASYSYNYRTDSSSKSESSDASGNVRGQFSFVAGDGVTRSLSYTAGGDQGFVPSGDHLPVAPVAPAAAPISPVSSLPSVAIARIAASSKIGHSDAGYVVNQYLPPQSHRKYGYIYDTKA